MADLPNDPGSGQITPRVAAVPRRPFGASVSIKSLRKSYGTFAAIAELSMDIEAGEFITILGPSGSGKTTTMMAVAGFLDGYSGQILIGGRRIDHLPPDRRDIGVVFQHLALFPHMTVSENIAFPLRMRGMSRAEIRKKVADVLELIDLRNLEARFPNQLSGGQQQRVALARAIVFSPPLLLLDEPFGALDRKLRERLQIELKQLHRRTGVTVIHVTHDQGEAMAVSDRIAVMSRGRIEQFSAPGELYCSPKNRFVADFIGDSIFLQGTLRTTVDRICIVETDNGIRCRATSPIPIAPGTKVTLIIRPDSLLLNNEAQGIGNEFSCVVVDLMFMGDRTKFEIALGERDRITAILPNQNGRPRVQVGEKVLIGWRAENAFVFSHQEP